LLKTGGHLRYPTLPVAVYPDEAIQAHLAFLARRRALRPGEDYRVPTDKEWEELLGHFELRKIRGTRPVADLNQDGVPGVRHLMLPIVRLCSGVRRRHPAIDSVDHGTDRHTVIHSGHWCGRVWSREETWASSQWRCGAHHPGRSGCARRRAAGTAPSRMSRSSDVTTAMPTRVDAELCNCVSCEAIRAMEGTTVGDFAGILRARVRRAREAARLAAASGDEYRAQVHDADLANLYRLAAEHGVEPAVSTDDAART
jgi:hypothetical protein